MSGVLAELTSRIARCATHYDCIGEWPEQSVDALTAAGAWTWSIPRSHGGMGIDAVSQLLGYEAIAAGCLSTLLILTQRDGACHIIEFGENAELRDRLLPRLAAHEVMTSVGISQLTTSRRGDRPALRAEPDGDGFRLRGYIPWVTAAEKCDFVVAGAVLPDDQQLLFVLPTDAPGVLVDPPMKLMALDSSLTSEIHCKDVHVDPSHIIRGPVERVLAARSPVSPLVVATAGIGHAGAMMRLIMTHAARSSDRLAELAEDLSERFDATRERIFKYADSLHRPDASVPKTEIRVAVNDLVLRLAIATLTYAKGSGLLRQRDAQRLNREAMFFIAWSAPEDVRAATLAGFLTAHIDENRTMETD